MGMLGRERYVEKVRLNKHANLTILYSIRFYGNDLPPWNAFIAQFSQTFSSITTLNSTCVSKQIPQRCHCGICFETDCDKLKINLS